jgi:hypothetical protein
MPRTISMPSSEDIAKEWEAAIPRVPAKYLDRVKKTTGFKEKAIAGEATYRAVMERVLAEERRAKGLARIKDEDWKAGVEQKGAKRIADGMTLAKEKRKVNYEPFRAALHGATIPDKGADPIDNAARIVPEVVKILVNKKRELLGLGK